MLLRLPKKNKLVFGGTKTGTFRNHLANTRTRMARKLENPRLLRIHFHTFSHWFATRIYWTTKDLLFTKQSLGHVSINSTLRYTQLVNWENENEYHSSIAGTVEEARKLLEGGWD